MKWWNTGSGSGKHSLVRQWKTTKWTPKAGATPVWPTAAKQGAPRRTLLTTLKSWLPCNFVFDIENSVIESLNVGIWRRNC